MAVTQKRKQIWIDRFQTYLSLRLAAYFVLYQIAVWSIKGIEGGLGFALERVAGQEAAAHCSTFAVIVVVTMGLLFIFDAMRLAHRLVGPLYRFRKTIQAIAAGEEVVPIRLRRDDFLHDLQDEFNEMLAYLEQRGAVTLKSAEAKPEPAQPVSA